MRVDQELFLTELRVPLECRPWRWVRWELFIFCDVRDVLATGDPRRVLVLHRGRAQIERWGAALNAAARAVD